MMKLEEFDKMAEEFLQPLDDEDKIELRDTEWRRASDVMSMLRKHLYQEDIDRDARYEQYLKLKAEFGSEGYTR